MVERVVHDEEGAAGWADGVGETPWYHVDVPYTPIGRLDYGSGQFHR